MRIVTIVLVTVIEETIPSLINLNNSNMYSLPIIITSF